MIFAPFFLFTIYNCFFPNANKIALKILLYITPAFIFFSQLDAYLSMPIQVVEVDFLNTKIVYHLGTANVLYYIYSFILYFIAISSIVYYLFSKTTGKRIAFVIILACWLISALNDVLVLKGVINNIFMTEFLFSASFSFIFLDFILENRKIHLSVVELKDQAIRRLHIMEIYTRRSLVEAIERGDDPTKFVSKNVQITTLFSDIRDFTGISEGKEPIEVVNLLNNYFEQMNKVIIKYGGEIDKLMGDCIMALFHNPDDSLKAAIEMRKELTEFNIGVNNCSPIQNGIGLNYGEVIIGNIGSESKMDYTVVGDIVNTASRLEALTKYYKVHLIISEEMKKQLEGSYHIRFLDEVLVKGKSNPMKIYEVFDFEPPEVIAMKERNVKPLAEAFAYYQQGEFEKAIEIYEALGAIQELPLQDPVLPFFISRCRKLQEQKQAGLLKQWNGVFEFMDK